MFIYIINKKIFKNILNLLISGIKFEYLKTVNYVTFFFFVIVVACLFFL